MRIYGWTILRGSVAEFDTKIVNTTSQMCMMSLLRSAAGTNGYSYITKHPDSKLSEYVYVRP